MTSHKLPNGVEHPNKGGPDSPLVPSTQDENTTTPAQPQTETSNASTGADAAVSRSETLYSPAQQESSAITRVGSGVSITQSQNSGQEAPESDAEETVSTPAAPNSTSTETPSLPHRNIVFRRIEELDRNGNVTVTEEETFIAPDGQRHTASNVVRPTSDANANATSGRFYSRVASRALRLSTRAQSVQRGSTRTSNNTEIQTQTQTHSTCNTSRRPVTSVAHLRVSGQQFTTIQLMTVVDQFQDPNMSISTFLDLISVEIGSGRMVPGDGPDLFKFDPTHPGNVMRGRSYEGYESNVSVRELLDNWYGYTPMHARY